MSSYIDKAFHPVRRVVMDALWIDDHFGRHQYGVRFDGEPRVYRPDEVKLPDDPVSSR